MNSSNALLSCRIVAFGFGNLVKRRGMKQLRLDGIHYKVSFNPGLQMEPEKPEPEKRMDDTKYSPGRWTERKYQATWREAVIEEPKSHEEVKSSHSQEERPPFRELRRTTDPTRRLQRIAIPANQFISQFISTQSKNKRRHVEAAADRMAFDGYQTI
ncbi:uncharacterized protein LOC6528578 [Drosophila yakuba]|uniref:Uncharacterized protein n=1 Tax=Drosophila yakuba TaxID=7245 RepID=B4P2S2_DROYA|nr:uncharacterized protein LOC6528578 [Drosophila yakuba]XP_043062809.1 uncharacterized protein LOC6528578 [Drosophila yakuba]EDW89333.1 uncharacterized protein Dyak_GE23080 [Drosophila yakuba]